MDCACCKQKHDEPSDCKHPDSFAMQLANTRPAKLKNIRGVTIGAVQIRPWMIKHYNSFHPNALTTLEAETNAATAGATTGVNMINPVPGNPALPAAPQMDFATVNAWARANGITLGFTNPTPNPFGSQLPHQPVSAPATQPIPQPVPTPQPAPNQPGAPQQYLQQ